MKKWTKEELEVFRKMGKTGGSRRAKTAKRNEKGQFEPKVILKSSTPIMK